MDSLLATDLVTNDSTSSKPTDLMPKLITTLVGSLTTTTMSSDVSDIEITPNNRTVDSTNESNDECRILDLNYDLTMVVICGLYLIFGVVYSLFGE
jgi:hypothetical protein